METRIGEFRVSETEELMKQAREIAEAVDGQTAGQPPSLHRKLAEVSLAVHRIPKRGKNVHFGYDYATEADVSEAIRRELAERGITLTPSITRIEREALPVAQGKRPEFLTTIFMHYTFTDAETGEVLEADWIGAGVDGSDKGAYKAMTGAHKYFLMKFFMIPTGDDPERDRRADNAATAPRARGSAPPAHLSEGPPPEGDVSTVAGAEPEAAAIVATARARFMARLAELAKEGKTLDAGIMQFKAAEACGREKSAQDRRWILYGLFLQKDISEATIKAFTAEDWAYLALRLKSIVKDNQ
jgi:hypothetical protein